MEGLVFSYNLHPTPYTLHPTTYTLHPTPHILLQETWASRASLSIFDSFADACRCTCPEAQD